jgi:hypothetical protein
MEGDDGMKRSDDRGSGGGGDKMVIIRNEYSLFNEKVGVIGIEIVRGCQWKDGGKVPKSGNFNRIGKIG